MPKAYLAVRAEVPEADRARFDHWYETDHLPWALRVFAARRGHSRASVSGCATAAFRRIVRAGEAI